MILEFRVESLNIRLIIWILLIVVGYLSCGCLLIMIKMQKKLAEDSEISSLISSEDEHETALSSYYSSEKVESPVNIEQ